MSIFKPAGSGTVPAEGWTALMRRHGRARNGARRLARLGRKKNAIHEMFGLPDHTLRDIGVDRLDILYGAWGGSGED